MHPWKVSIGITVTVLGLAAILGGAELSFMRPYWSVFLRDYALTAALYGGIAVVTFAVSIYALARSLGLADLGRKVDLVERSIRRGEGGDTELAEALRSQEKGEFPD